MKHKTRIVSRGSKYIGELLQDGQVIYTTEELSDPIIVSRALASYISQITPSPISDPVIASQAPNSVPVATGVTRNFLASERTPARHAYPPTTRKCCGRG